MPSRQLHADINQTKQLTTTTTTGHLTQQQQQQNEQELKTTSNTFDKKLKNEK